MVFGLENFNPANEFNILRIVCGAFFIPHIIGKFFADGGIVRLSLQQAGMRDDGFDLLRRQRPADLT